MDLGKEINVTYLKHSAECISTWHHGLG